MMGAGSKKDLGVSKVGPGGSLNDFISLLIEVLFQIFAVGKEEGRGIRILRERSTTKSFQDSPAAPGKIMEKASDLFMHAPLGLGTGDIAQLVELRSCNWVVVIMVGVGGSPRVTSSGIPGEEDQVGPCEQLDALSPFNPSSKICQKEEKAMPWTDRLHPWNALAVRSGWAGRVREGQSLILKTKESGRKKGELSVPGSLVAGYSRTTRIPGMGFQLSTFWEELLFGEHNMMKVPVILADTMVYDSTKFCQSGSLIYDLSFMDIDKILPFSSTLGWHSLQQRGIPPQDECSPILTSLRASGRKHGRDNDGFFVLLCLASPSIQGMEGQGRGGFSTWKGHQRGMEEPHQSILNLLVKLYCARLLQNPTHILTSFLFHSTLWNVIPALIEINLLPHPLNLEWMRRGKVPSGRDSWEQIQWKRGLQLRGLEHMATNHGVGGSNPSSPTNNPKREGPFPLGGRGIMIGIADAKLWNSIFTKVWVLCRNGMIHGLTLSYSTPDINRHICVCV
eukprot:Gb_11362 [translate_table: standard]